MINPQSREEAVARLREGAELLRPFLAQHGFDFELLDSGRGSGGYYAQGQFIRRAAVGNDARTRVLDLHVRGSLGMVRYIAGEDGVYHERYMEKLGVERPNYPGFKHDSLMAFRLLLSDLQAYGREFLSGDLTIHTIATEEEREAEANRNIQMMAGAVGDTRRREQARKCFKEGDYAETVRLLRELKYPELLGRAELSMLRIAEKRAKGD